jgi:hypothetical protein
MSEKRGCLSVILGWFAPKKKISTRKDDELKEKEITFPYHVRDDFLSPAEFSFYRVLQGMMRDYFSICPKVALAELFYVDHPNENHAAFGRIRQKRVDFVICDPTTMKPRFAIELDDSSHKREDRQERDEFVDKVFEAAGLPLVHIPARSEYNTQELGVVFKRALSNSKPADILPLPKSPIVVTPKGTPALSIITEPDQNMKHPPKFCPKCGGQLVERVAQNGDYKGKKFLGCSNYPKCRYIYTDN